MWMSLFVLLACLGFSIIAKGVPHAEFLTRPTRISVKEGEPASFICTVKAKKPIKSAIVTWSDNYKTYQDMDSSILIRDNFNATVVRSHLQLLVTNRHSRKYFKCAVSITFIDGTTGSLASPLVGVDVQYFLQDTDLQCRKQPDEAFYREHENINIECEAPNTNPSVSLEWMMCSQRHPFLPEEQTLTRLGDRALLRMSILTDRQLHDKNLCCVATSSAFTGRQVNCSLEPFKIFHVPQVEVVPDREFLMPSIVSETLVSCNVISVPHADEITWSCEPPDVFKSCESTGPYLNVSLARSSLGPQSENVTVECTARNVIGFGRDIKIIGVNYVNVETIELCPLKYEHVNASLYQGQTIVDDPTNNNPLIIYMKPGPTDNIIYCSLTQLKMTSMSAATWYVNGSMVHQQSDADSSDVINGRWHYAIPHGSRNTVFRGTVACEVRGPNTSHIAACMFDYGAQQRETSSIGSKAARKQLLGDVTTVPHEVPATSPNISAGTASVASHLAKETPIVRKQEPATAEASTSKVDPPKLVWMLVLAVIIGFALLGFIVALVVLVKKFWSRSRNALVVVGGVYSTTMPKTLMSSGESFPTSEAVSNDLVEQEPLYAVPDENNMSSERASLTYVRQPHLYPYDCDKTIVNCPPPKEFRSSIYSCPGSFDSSTGDDEESYVRGSYEEAYSDISSSSGSHVYENKNVVHLGASDKNSAYYKAKSLDLHDLQGSHNEVD